MDLPSANLCVYKQAHSEVPALLRRLRTAVILNVGPGCPFCRITGRALRCRVSPFSSKYSAKHRDEIFYKFVSAPPKIFPAEARRWASEGEGYAGQEREGG